jgi:alkylation response protein AidB-like acyl-CoA dehydrogenase
MYQLDTNQQAIIGRIREIAESIIGPAAGGVDSEGRFPAEAIGALGEAGFMGLTIPAAHGGMGQSLACAAALVDEIAQRCGSTAMVYMMHLCGVSCYLASPERFSKVLGAAARGEHLSTLAFSERGSRSQFWAPVSKVVANGEGYSLSAEKSWVTSAGIADGMVASSGSRDGQGASVWLVNKYDPGITVSGGWDSLGMRGNQSNPMSLKEVPLGPERLIGEEGKGADIMLGKALPIFLICQGAIGVGLAEAAFGAARKHITGSGFEHTGTKLSDLPNQRARLARMRIEADTTRAYLAATVAKVEAGDADAMLHLLAVKASAAEAAVRTTDLAMRACGGAAFSRHLGLERIFRDARAATVMAPTTDHLHEFAGRLLCGMELFG